MSWSLVGGRTVKVPFLELRDRDWLSLLDSHGLASHATISVDPDVCIVSLAPNRASS